MKWSKVAAIVLQLLLVLFALGVVIAHLNEYAICLLISMMVGYGLLSSPCAVSKPYW